MHYELYETNWKNVRNIYQAYLVKSLPQVSASFYKEKENAGKIILEANLYEVACPICTAMIQLNNILFFSPMRVHTLFVTSAPHRKHKQNHGYGETDQAQHEPEGKLLLFIIPIYWNADPDNFRFYNTGSFPLFI
jgi:hypothetical protein